jgi:hypothetical protein
VLTPPRRPGFRQDGVHFAVADATRRSSSARSRCSPSDAAQALGEAARRLVVEQMSWPAMLASLPALSGAPTERRDAA